MGIALLMSFSLIALATLGINLLSNTITHVTNWSVNYEQKY